MGNEKLYTDTPMGQAIIQAMAEINDDISEQVADAEPGTYRAYIFGGAALHIHTNARGSSDIDVEFEAAQALELGDITIIYVDDDGLEKTLVVDDTFTPTISGLLSEYYQDDAIPLFGTDSDPLIAYVVTALDLAVSKLDRLAVDDQTDIISLHQAGKFTAEELREHAEEALIGAVGNERRLKGNIEFMVNQLLELES
ncbi:DUF6036 family nucleotidyltransferase [Thalassolituus marinus]|uniref:DUF6036 domain-containing protein n=1 Tax=Thalassolituus marinus TaxID=671053 RepID=A0ABS7ZQ81_9GAMM|nr:DUF6036 family nucleotidyltransferase [Thalassolituus marinus]MCA6062510.1 hypothetical protein [Thalassolituus marinus]